MKRILVVKICLSSSFVFSRPTRISATQRPTMNKLYVSCFDEISAALGRATLPHSTESMPMITPLITSQGELTTNAPRLAAKSGELEYESVSFDEVNIRL